MIRITRIILILMAIITFTVTPLISQVTERVSLVGSTAITTNQVTVDTTAGGTLIRAFNTFRISLIIRNQGAVDAYIGSVGVTTTTGILLKAGESLTIDNNTAAIYGITAATNTVMSYLEE